MLKLKDILDKLKEDTDNNSANITNYVNNKAEYIVAEGENANGKYRKWNSGILEQWVNKTVQFSIPNAYVTLFQGLNYWTFPIPFLEIPDYGICSKARWDTSVSWCYVEDMSTTQLTIRVIDVSKKASGNTHLIAYARGKWK